MAGAEQMTLYFEPIDDDNENPPSPPPTDMPASSAAAKPTDTSSQPTDKSIVAVGLGGTDVQTSRAPAGLAWEHCLLRNPPTARAGHSLCTVECGKTGACGVLLFGGATRTARFFNDAHVLEKGSTQWTQLRLKGNKRPPPRSGHSAVCHDGTMFVFGGQRVQLSSPTSSSSSSGTTDQPQFVFYNDVWSLQRSPSSSGAPPTWEWTELKCSGSTPPGRNGHSASVIGDHMYVCGGSGADGPSDTTYVLHLGTLKWSVLSLTGTPSNAPKPAKGVPQDSKNSSMTALGMQPQPREGHSAWVGSAAQGPFEQKHDSSDSASTGTGGHPFILIAGGRGLLGLLDDCFKLWIDPTCPTNGQWEYCGAAPAVCNHSAVAVDGCAALFGGVSDQSAAQDALLVSSVQLTLDKGAPVTWSSLEFANPADTAAASSSASTDNAATPKLNAKQRARRRKRQRNKKKNGKQAGTKTETSAGLQPDSGAQPPDMSVYSSITTPVQTPSARFAHASAVVPWLDSWLLVGGLSASEDFGDSFLLTSQPK